MVERSVSWKVETRTRASSLFLVAALLLVAVAVAAPAFVGRGTLRALFFILTLLVLAQSWNLLAGYAGLVSVGQQAFVGFGAYAMFAAVSLWGLDPLSAIALAGVPAGLLALPTGFFVFRLQVKTVLLRNLLTHGVLYICRLVVEVGRPGCGHSAVCTIGQGTARQYNPQIAQITFVLTCHLHE